MPGDWIKRRLVVLAALSVGLVFTGCAAATQPAGSPMMRGSGPLTPQSTGSGMMPSGSAYHYSRLTCAAPSSLPGRIVRVTLADMGMTQMMGGTAPLGVRMMLRATPATASAGKISLVASNMGWRTHELVVLPLVAGAVSGQRKPGPDGRVDEKGSLGESSKSCSAGAGEGITARTVGWDTVTLAPGRYELLCNLANHYADGMHQELDVR